MASVSSTFRGGSAVWRRSRGRRFQLILSYSSLHSGWPGVGLLLLRAAVGVCLVAHGVAHLVADPSPSFATVAFIALEGGSGALLTVGFLTPIAGALAAGCGVANTFSWLPEPPFRLFDNPIAAACVAVMAAAVALLGPGAYSIDARLFGRREIVIPRARRTSRP